MRPSLPLRLRITLRVVAAAHRTGELLIAASEAWLLRIKDRYEATRARQVVRARIRVERILRDAHRPHPAAPTRPGRSSQTHAHQAARPAATR
ncbi:hypothetical protein [Xylanimonas ulmi]|uniref:Uncharacterized protein n=1 Tax=Xylanimonas ulmi TaxID=228973 RepID=A0A4Q7M594_9MICO|nr:hypothetical protein [Xylanibacterium ulmi]RZS62203.1 hypothetical protein EV386_2524 [Xylanibacterium ulmi]